MDTRNLIGFRPSWTDGDPQYAPVQMAEPIVPKGLASLRKKIAQVAVFMTTPAFAKMPKAGKINLIAEFAELTAIEQGYADAVGGPSDMTEAAVEDSPEE